MLPRGDQPPAEAPSSEHAGVFFILSKRCSSLSEVLLLPLSFGDLLHVIEDGYRRRYQAYQSAWFGSPKVLGPAR